MAQVILTGSGTWTLPADWNDAVNTIEIYGAGGDGAAGTVTASGGGGAGGLYFLYSNVPFATLISQGYVTNLNYNTKYYFAGSNVAYLGIGTTDGSTYGNILLSAGGNNANGITGGAFAAGSQTINNTDYATSSNTVGVGGNGRASTTAAGGGGGGAGGPNGRGGAGGANSTTNPTIGRGGGGGNGGTAGSGTTSTAGTAGTGAGAGGAGGAASTSGTAGGNATTGYSGGGGGGAGDGITATSGGAGGLYGGGGGGGASSVLSTGGLGAAGIIIITYTPIATSTGNMFLMF